MNPEPYTKRELDSKFDNVIHILDIHGETHNEILDQVKKTNGRVTKLELWKAGLAGGVAVLSIMVVPLLFFVIEKL